MKKLFILVALLLGLAANLQAGSISPPILTTGVTGPRGGFGGDSQPYTYSTTTTDADPGSGNLRFNNATLASATKAYIDLNNSDGTTVTAWIDALDDSTSTIKGTVRFFKKSDQSVFAVYQLAANTTASGYRKLNLTYVTGNGSFTNGEAVVASFTRQGDLGATGATGATGADGADATPGGSNTQVQFNDSDALGGDSNFVWDNTNKTLNIIGTAQKTRASIGSSTISNQAVVQIKNQATDFDVFGEVLQIQGVISSTSSGSGVGIATDVTANQTDGNLFFVEGHDIQIQNSSTGDIGDIWGLGVFIHNGALGGTITTAEGIHISPFTSASGSISDVIALNIDNQTVGATSNKAIKTGTGLVEFGDKVNVNGHLEFTGTDPVVTNTSADSCGTTAATLAGKDGAGKVTVGATSGTSCTVTFNQTWTNAPSCSVTNETTANLARATSTTSTVILAGTFVAGDVLAYSCIGWK